MRGVGNETSLLIHQVTYSLEQPVDRSDERMEFARRALLGKPAQIVRAPGVQLACELNHRPQRLPYHDRDHEHQARRQNRERKNNMKGTVARDFVAYRGGLTDGKPAAIRPRPQQDPPWLLIARDDMQAVLKPPERAGVGRTARPVAQFLDSYLRLRVDAAVDRRIVLEAGIERKAPIWVRIESCISIASSNAHWKPT